MSSPLLSTITSLFSGPDVAVDLGTSNTRLFTAGAGMVAVPTKVNISRRKKFSHLNSPRSDKAGRGTEFVRPLHSGAIKNIPAAAFFLKKLLKRTSRFGFSRPRVIVCAPGDSSESEHAALIEALRQ